jgi:hypothetical protein
MHSGSFDMTLHFFPDGIVDLGLALTFGAETADVKHRSEARQHGQSQPAERQA